MDRLQRIDTEFGMSEKVKTPVMEIEMTHSNDTSRSLSVNDNHQKKLSIVDDVISRPDVTLQDFAHLDIRKINRKIDWRLLPILTLLNFMSFLDRGTIGNARIQGMPKDLHLTSQQFNLGMTVFFFTYAAFEIPSNMMLKKFRPSVWIPVIMVAWGIVMTLTSLVQNYGGLLTVRLLLGATEAGLSPGVSYYLTMWYPRYEIQVRNAYFFSAFSLSGAFGGLIGFAVEHMDGVAGLASWRWLFIIEGLITVVIAVMAWFLLHDFPETASFLTPSERAFVAYRLKYDGMDDSVEGGLKVPQTDKKGWKFMKQAFKDPIIYIIMVTNLGIVTSVYGIALSLPVIIKDMGYKSTTAQLMTMPIYFTACALTFVVAYAADHYKRRIPFILGSYALSVFGFALCASGGPPHRTYAGIFIASCGCYPAIPTCLSLITNNLAGSYKRAIGLPYILTFGVMGGAAASNFYRSQDAPKYILGHSLEVGFTAMGFVGTILLLLSYTRLNRNRERRCAAGEHLTMSLQELSEQGDKAVTFRYTL